jgi:Flp pilus assembly protein CpaB
MATAGPPVRRVNLPVLILGAVLALAGFGVTLLLALNSGPSATATGNQPVVVAARDLDQRSVLQSSDLMTEHWAAADVPPDALTSPRTAVGQVLLASLKRGQPVLTNQIGQAGDVTGQQPAFLPLAKGYVAATLPSSELPGVGGYVQAGDYIDIVAIVASRSGGSSNVRTIYSGVRVIRVGAAGNTAPGPPNSLTLAVSECQAEFLNWFVANASLKYTLLAHDDYAAAAAAPADTACPAGSPSKGVTEADIKTRWPGLLG